MKKKIIELVKDENFKKFDENAFINKFEYNLSKVYPKIFIKNLPHNISEWNEEHYKIAENICYEIDDN